MSLSKYGARRRTPQLKHGDAVLCGTAQYTRQYTLGRWRSVTVTDRT